MKRFGLNGKSYQMIMQQLFEGMYFTDKNKLVLYWNKGAEKITGYESAAVVGKEYCRDFLKHVDKDGKSLCDIECPIDTSLAGGKTCDMEVYVQHKEGYRVPVSVRTIPVTDKEQQIIGVVELFRDNSPREMLAKELEEMRQTATLDGLTGLRNRSFAEIVIGSRITELQAGGLPFGLLFADIDHFKTVNDTYGHDVGDLVLKMVAKTLLNNTRQTDLVVRWGGEEMVVVLVGANMSDKLPKIAEKLRILISESMLSLEEGTSIRVTVSIGATLARLSDTVDTLIRRGDQLMYECKKAGRNCVRVQR